jgi:Ser-tRNA(Ala) deacylase AlaX
MQYAVATHQGLSLFGRPLCRIQGNDTCRPALLEKLQAAFQELVQDDIDTTIEVLSKENAEEVCNRVAENYFNLSEFGDDTIRIVTVAGWPCPCGGTHVKSTGGLKDRKWGITGLKCKKGVVRVKYAPNWDS